MSLLVFVHELANLMGVSLFWQPATFILNLLHAKVCRVDCGLLLGGTAES